MLVRVYTSVPSGKEFFVHRNDHGTLLCTCKEYRGGEPHQRTCRHIRDYRQLAATWTPSPFDTLDWL